MSLSLSSLAPAGSLYDWTRPEMSPTVTTGSDGWIACANSSESSGMAHTFSNMVVVVMLFVNGTSSPAAPTFLWSCAFAGQLQPRQPNSWQAPLLRGRLLHIAAVLQCLGSSSPLTSSSIVSLDNFLRGKTRECFAVLSYLSTWSTLSMTLLPSHASHHPDATFNGHGSSPFVKNGLFLRIILSLVYSFLLPRLVSVDSTINSFPIIAFIQSTIYPNQPEDAFAPSL